MSDLAAFLGISILVIVTPGPDTALTIRNALRGGRGSGILTALGIVTGQTIWTLATSAGLAALLVASEPAFVALKLVGAAYLLFLGAQALLAAVRPHASEDATTGDRSARRLAPSVAYRQGVISNLGNPKMAAFFTSLLPQFTLQAPASFFVLLSLGLVFCSLTLAWLTSYAIAVAKAGDFLRQSAIRRTLEGLMGAVLVALGLRLAIEHR
jgi:threonine/homoserine/homoserine lactone efflux protein